MSTTTRTAVATQTETQTITVQSADVRLVMGQASQEIRTLLASASHVAPAFDFDRAWNAISIFVLNDAIASIHLEFSLEGQLVREHAYIVADGPLAPGGPPPDRPPTGPVPERARVRLVVLPNPRCPKEERDRLFGSLGWRDGTPLHRPPGLEARAYGAFASGGYAVERRVLVNPAFDGPVTGTTTSAQR